VSQSAEFDAVVIGRNEGARLPSALRAVVGLARKVIYVDSGSGDNSVAVAQAAGVEVLELDPARPFSAARARNEGFAALGEGRARYVQFIDGDCILQPGWPAQAVQFLADHPKAGLVFGRQFEARPDASVYNFLTDWEWDKPLGADIFCAGCVMMRAEALEGICGYDPTLIAGEDDDMCIRLQQAGWQTWRIDAAMTEHDARLLSFAPWWRRAVRAGHSYGALGVRHGGRGRAQRIRAVVWGGVLPVLACLGLVYSISLFFIVLALYIVSLSRQTLRFHRMGLSRDRAVAAAATLMVGKFAELQGLALFRLRHMQGKRETLIEYK